MSKAAIRRLMREHKGATIIFVAIAMVMILGFAALAVDVGYLYVVRNQLQNAADSGALAGAQVLYNNAGTSVNDLADDVGADYARRHLAEQEQVVVLSSERGHWSFATRTFTPNDSLAPVDLWDTTTEELDANIDFINAVRVITRRKRDAAGILPAHIFGQIFGGSRAEVMATAVGYIGFAGTLLPFEVDQPIAICEESIRDGDGHYTCGVGRMINSGQTTTHQTGGWTNFSQPCETANVPSVRPLICTTGNAEQIRFGEGMGTVGGELQTAADRLRACWMSQPGIDVAPADGWPEQPWSLTLPVIKCPDNNVSPCSQLVGAVTLNIVWMTRTDKNQMIEVPRKMANWPTGTELLPDGTPLPRAANGTCAGTGAQCWASFVKHFNLVLDPDFQDPNDSGSYIPATYEDKTIYFLPDCTPHPPAGITGGTNFGILAKIPVLVK